MNFYQTFSNYYDIIFPFAGAKKSFFERLLTQINPANALDLGCATGELCNWLAGQGLKATGVDLSPDLIQLALERQQLGAEFFSLDMIAFLKGTNKLYDLIVCIGNTLPHLKPEDLSASIALMTEHLTPGGTLVIQTVNYHHILRQKPPGLSTIKRPGAGVTFTRLYNYNHDGSIIFTANLKTPEGEDWASVTLWPFTAEELTSQFADTITVENQYGGFDCSHYDTNHSPAWISIARRATDRR